MYKTLYSSFDTFRAVKLMQQIAATFFIFSIFYIQLLFSNESGMIFVADFDVQIIITFENEENVLIYEQKLLFCQL